MLSSVLITVFTVYSVSRSFEAERSAVSSDRVVLDGFQNIGELLQLWPGYEMAALGGLTPEHAISEQQRLAGAWDRWLERERALRPVLVELSTMVRDPQMLVDLDEASDHAREVRPMLPTVINARLQDGGRARAVTTIYEFHVQEGVRELREVRVGLSAAALAIANRREGELARRQRFTLLVSVVGLPLLLFTGWTWYRTDQSVKALTAERDRWIDAEAQRAAQVSTALERVSFANRELELFASAVAHDLKAPLRQIRGYATLLHDGMSGRLEADEREHLQFMEAAASKAMGQIDDLYALAHVTTRPLIRMPVDLSHLAGAVVEELRSRSPGRQVEVVIEPGLEAHADPGLTQVLLTNLLDNAWKFTARTPAARIEVRRHADPAWPAGGFVVRDNGAGFPEGVAERIFTPFSRFHRTDDYPGTGLGLATVFRIIQRHDGRIVAEGRPGAGATFRFALES